MVSKDKNKHSVHDKTNKMKHQEQNNDKQVIIKMKSLANCARVDTIP